LFRCHISTLIQCQFAIWGIITVFDSYDLMRHDLYTGAAQQWCYDNGVLEFWNKY